MVEKPAPCHFGRWVSMNLGVSGVVKGLPDGRAVSLLTPEVQPFPGQEGQGMREGSSCATTAMTNVA
jgi:hypothetical protein